MSVCAHPYLFDFRKFEKALEENNNDIHKVSADDTVLVKLTEKYHHAVLEFSGTFSDFDLIYHKDSHADTLAMYVLNVLLEKYPDADINDLSELSIYADNSKTYIDSTPYLNTMQIENIMKEFEHYDITFDNATDENIKALIAWFNDALENDLGVIYMLL